MNAKMTFSIAFLTIFIPTCLLFGGGFTTKKAKREPVACDKTRKCFGEQCSLLLKNVPSLLRDLAHMHEQATEVIQGLVEGDKQAHSMRMTEAHMKACIAKAETLQTQIEATNKALREYALFVQGVSA